jgi:hypothetical protein
MTPIQLPNESLRAFAAFKHYVEMGDKSSIRACARKLHVSSTIIARFSVKYRWQKRLRELELENCKRAVKADELAKLNVAEERERERLKFQQRALEASRKATERALTILKQPLKGTRPSDAARLLAVGNMIGRAALGLTTESTGAFGLRPTGAPPIFRVIHEPLPKEATDAWEQFAAANPADPAVVGRSEISPSESVGPQNEL